MNEPQETGELDGNELLPHVKELQPHGKEQAILEAAEREFLTKGFDGARTASIAAAAGVTHAMLHYYFRTKENIFERILDQKLRLMGESVLSAFGRPELPLLERLQEGISRHFDFLVDNPDLPRFLVNEISSKPERFEVMRRQVEPIIALLVGGVQREIDSLAAQGSIERIDMRHLMLDVLSLNIFPFIAYPVIEPLIGDVASDRADFYAQRKRETIETIMRRLKNHNP